MTAFSPTGPGGADEVAEMMEAYSITRTDWDSIQELDQVRNGTLDSLHSPRVLPHPT